MPGAMSFPPAMSCTSIMKNSNARFPRRTKGTGPMLDDLAAATCEIDGTVITYTFANGLLVRAEIPEKNDRYRILSLARPQGAVMNYLMKSPSRVEGKRVFEPFAGSGGLGFMAYKLGAK